MSEEKNRNPLIIELAQAETKIEAYFSKMAELSEALRTIRDEQLYRGTHATFEEYCQQRFDLDELTLSLYLNENDQPRKNYAEANGLDD